ncbi:odorant receptor 94a-like [Sitophilus oryzae]|uniref:Odorant receptor 94a-like n=1 Tax=Sitophilus oryzae TaxID=7048 RepID=A0A6J2YR58_SITOR|nr:odorant receptor 94a-like [Sitophilus oryzae]
MITQVALYCWAGHNMRALESSHIKQISENLKLMTFLRKVYRGSCLLGSVFYSVPPLLNKQIVYALPITAYLPYNIDSDFKYISTFIGEVIAILVSAHLNTLVDVINVRLVTLASCLLQVLMNKFEIIGSKMKKNYTEEFRNCLVFHNKILRFIEEIEKFYRYISFAQLTASATVICFSAFGLASVPFGSGEFGICLIYLVNMITQVALYCWVGHNMRALSENVGRACYMSQWYETDIDTRKMMIVFMERAKRPVTLTAAKMFPMTMTTLTSILRSSYSYFALLQQVYSEK